MRCCKFFFWRHWCKTILSCLPVLMQIACSSVSEKTEMRDWIELSFLVDGAIDIQLKVPPEKNRKGTDRMQFIGTKDDSSARLFIAGYDPGRGKYRDISMIHILGVVVRVERENDDGTNLSHEDIQNEIYMSRPNAAETFEFIGEQVFTGQSWLRINLIGGTQRKGVSYALSLNKNYALILTMYMYGEESNKTRLFKKRQETLEQILATVKVSTVDF